jgi:endonuclease/exonuclease/phosphatase family metal-dependent hydrolase
MVKPDRVEIYANRISIRAGLLLAVLVLSCSGSDAWAQAPGIGGKPAIDVASINLYHGADLVPLTVLDPTDPNFPAQFITGVATIYGKIVASDFPKRADALAREIVVRAPDVVGLQEVALLRRQSPGDAITGGTTPATQVETDYLAILLNALDYYGGHYAVAAQVQNVDVEVPLITSTGSFDDLRFTDRDVILVRTDLPPGQLRVSNPQGQNFVARIPAPIGLDVLRGWTSIDVWLRGRSFRFVNTHIENPLPPGLPDFQQFQTLELLAGPVSPNSAMPLILVGDFNSDANGAYSPAIHQILTGPGGLTDAWSVARPGDPGLTWGHDELLSDPSVAFLYRLDFILYRGSQFTATHAETDDPLIDSTPPLWFSDHAALFATLAIK